MGRKYRVFKINDQWCLRHDYQVKLLILEIQTRVGLYAGASFMKELLNHKED